MPIYEYQAVNPDDACPRCRHGFEIFQKINEKPLSACICCGTKVKKIVSLCRAAVIEYSEAHKQVENRIHHYEKSGMWSHAAELADKQSEKTRDKNLKTRALENYKLAGYDSDTLSRHTKPDD